MYSHLHLYLLLLLELNKKLCFASRIWNTFTVTNFPKQKYKQNLTRIWIVTVIPNSGISTCSTSRNNVRSTSSLITFQSTFTVTIIIAISFTQLAFIGGRTGTYTFVHNCSKICFILYSFKTMQNGYVLCVRLACCWLVGPLVVSL